MSKVQELIHTVEHGASGRERFRAGCHLLSNLARLLEELQEEPPNNIIRRDASDGMRARVKALASHYAPIFHKIACDGQESAHGGWVKDVLPPPFYNPEELARQGEKRLTLPPGDEEERSGDREDYDRRDAAAMEAYLAGEAAEETGRIMDPPGHEDKDIAKWLGVKRPQAPPPGRRKPRILKSPT